jgi:DNA topoisomerase-1
VLKDRDYVAHREEPLLRRGSGRLLTAFLERFFERYVAYDFTAGLEDELDDVSGGRAQWKAVLEAFWKDFKPKTDEVMEQKPSEVTEALDEFLPLSVPGQGRRIRPAQMPDVRRGAPFPARRALRRVHRLLQLSGVQVHPQVRQPGAAGEGAERPS